MAQSYVPEGTMIVCTEMKAPLENTIVQYRTKADVWQGSKSVYILNKKDLKLQTQFVCNINSKFWGGLESLCAIVAIGALMVGTVLTGGLLLVAMGVAVAATATSMFATYKKFTHDCDFTTKSKWIGYHPSLKINKDFALLQNSKLICSKGGALSLVVDPVLAKAAGEKIAANNSAEYNAHVNSQLIQGTLFVLSSGGDPRALAFGLPLTIWNYDNAENTKQKKRSEEIENRITNPDIQSSGEGAVEDVIGATPNAARDAAIGVFTEASYSPEMITSIANNAAIVSAYPGIVNASMRSAYPTATLRLNTSLYLAAAKQSFNPKAAGSLATGFGWGMAGAAVDVGSDVYENSLYDDTITYFKDLSDINKESKGINIISNK